MYSRILKGAQPGHPFYGNQWGPGQTARFSGAAADGSATGDFDVLVRDPHSNKGKVTHTDSRGRMYEDGRSHIPTATVVNLRTGRAFEAYHHTLKPAGPEAEHITPRDEGENDKVYAKRVIDKMPLPKSLPEQHDKYFALTPDAKPIALDDLVPSKPEEVLAKEGPNAAKRFRASTLGLLAKRGPITVRARADGKYDIVDGNGTYAALKRYGWKTLPAQVVEDVKKYSLVMKEEVWDPEKHPRDEVGRFTSGGGNAGEPATDSRSEAPPAKAKGVMDSWVERRNADMKTATEDWKKLPMEERLKMADTTNTAPARMKELLGDKPWPESGDLQSDIEQRVKQYGNEMHPEAQRMTFVLASEIHADMKELGFTDEQARKMVTDATDHVIAQEMESQTRILGDHGAHHLYGNASMARDILAVVPGANTAENRLAVSIAAVYHDMGYLTPPSRNFFDREHTEQGRIYFDEVVAPTIKGAMGEEWVKKVSNTVAKHDTTQLNWDNETTLTALAMADNLALFHKEKMPPLLREIPSATKELVAFGRKQITLDQLRTNLTKQMDAAKMTGAMRERFMHAIGELNPATPKFVMGMVGAKVEKFGWAEDHLDVEVVRRPANEALERVLDLGQKQFAKLAEQYGGTYGGKDEAIKKFLAERDITFSDGKRKLLRVRVRDISTKADGTEVVTERYIDFF